MTEGKSEAARIQAAVALLDRGYGKPAQAVQSTITRVDPTSSPTPSWQLLSRPTAARTLQKRRQMINSTQSAFVMEITV